MTLENILTIIDKFDSSESAYLELQMGEVNLKLKKAEACGKQVIVQGQQMIPAQQIVPGQQMIPGQASMVQPLEGQQAQGGLVVSEQPNQSDQTETKADGMPQIHVDYIKAPLVGVYYAAASPDKGPFVQVGSKVEKGDTVCLIEAMKMMSEVAAPRAGVIKEILVENGDLVEFDKPLFVIE